MSGGKIKFGGYKGGKGYCGFYINKDNKKLFLRSMLEFFIAKKLDYENTYFMTEQIIYVINKKIYKPDFFIYSDLSYKNLVKIIEVKSSKKEANKCYELYKTYFNSINIEYEVIGYEFDLRKNYNFISKNELDDWRQQYVDNYNIFDYRGKNNPMYGVHHSKKTKNKIGMRTKQYMKNKEIKKKHSTALKDFWKSDKAKIIKEKYRMLRKNEHEEFIKRKNIEDPLENRICKMCNIIFIERKSSNKVTCCNSCTQKYNWKIGKNTYHGNAKLAYKNRIINYCKLISENINENNFIDIIKKYKDKNIIPLHFGISINVINKYFNNFENFLLEIKQWENYYHSK